MIRRLLAEWRLKMWLALWLNSLFLLGYGSLTRHAYFPVWEMPLTWLDVNVAYTPVPWGWIYLSQFLITGVLPLLLCERTALLRYARGVVVMLLSSFGVFLFFPVALPRMPSEPLDSSMELIARHDGTFNCFPSLHAAFLVYLAGLAWRMFGKQHPKLVSFVAVVWGGAILYSTLATKQHYVWDLVAGLMVGWLAHYVAWRGEPESTAEMTARMRDSTSHEGVK